MTLRLRPSGALDPRLNVYVRRACDDALLAAVRSGETCLVFAPRQVGKTSLLVHAAQELADDYRVARVDLAGLVGETEAPRWCERFAAGVGDAVGLLTAEAAAEGEGPGEALVRAFDALRRAADRPVVVLVDEVQSLRALPFRVELLAWLRALRDHCVAGDGAQRVTFAFVGAAVLRDLVEGAALHPFEGTAIEVSDFTLGELKEGLSEAVRAEGGDAAALLAEVFGWTSGHPSMTQTLCIEALSGGRDGEVGARVRAAAEARYLTKGLRGSGVLGDAASAFAVDPAADERGRAARGRRVAEMLAIYERALAAGEGADVAVASAAGQGEALDALRIAGVVVMSGAGGGEARVRVRNRIYARVLDAGWVRETRGRRALDEKVRAWRQGARASAVLRSAEEIEGFERELGGAEFLAEDERALTLQARKELAAAASAEARAARRAARWQRAVVAALAAALAVALVAYRRVHATNRVMAISGVVSELRAARLEMERHEVVAGVIRAITALRRLEKEGGIGELDVTARSDLVALALLDRTASARVITTLATISDAALLRERRVILFTTGRTLWRAAPPRYLPEQVKIFASEIRQLGRDWTDAPFWVLLNDGARVEITPNGELGRWILGPEGWSHSSASYLLRRGGLVYWEGTGGHYLPIEGPPVESPCSLERAPILSMSDDERVLADAGNRISSSGRVLLAQEGRCFGAGELGGGLLNSISPNLRLELAPQGGYGLLLAAGSNGMGSAACNLVSGEAAPLGMVEPLGHYSPVSDYVHQDVFIPGGEGFLGRAYYVGQPPGLEPVVVSLRPPFAVRPVPFLARADSLRSLTISDDGAWVGGRFGDVYVRMSFADGHLTAPRQLPLDALVTDMGVALETILARERDGSALHLFEGSPRLASPVLLPPEARYRETFFLDDAQVVTANGSADYMSFRLSTGEIKPPSGAFLSLVGPSDDGAAVFSDVLAGAWQVKRWGVGGGEVFHCRGYSDMQRLDVRTAFSSAYQVIADGSFLRVCDLTGLGSATTLPPGSVLEHVELAGDLVLTVHRDAQEKVVRLWRRNGSTIVRLSESHEPGNLRQALFARQGTLVVSLFGDGLVRWREVLGRRIVGQINLRAGLVYDAFGASSPRESRILIRNGTQGFFLLDLERSEVTYRLPAASYVPSELRRHPFSPDSRRVIADHETGVAVFPTRMDDVVASLCEGLRWRAPYDPPPADLLAWCAPHLPTADSW